ncbi:MAG: hypothetical protein ACRDTD_32250 [Pseudonocardiaceae bacterium]
MPSAAPGSAVSHRRHHRRGVLLGRLPPPGQAVHPRSTEDDATMEVCRSIGVPVTSPGGGTSVAGNAIGSGVVLDVSRHTLSAIDSQAEIAIPTTA